MKKEVYFNEYNVLMDNTIYLPLASGMLQAYAQKNEIIKENYEFMPFNFIRDSPEKIISKYKNPSVAAFSVSMWNFNLSLEIAKQIKEKFPNCLIIFGGSHVPFKADDFFKKNPVVDIVVRGEGEKIFKEILLKFLKTRDFSGIPGISYRGKNRECITEYKELEPEKDLNNYPSPYTEGIFDDIIVSSNLNFQAIIETNRGCPFGCAYCFWGRGGLSNKFRFFDIEKIKKTAEWIGKNRIKFVFCADSNFGMFQRDLEIAKIFIDVKKKYGYLEKFSTSYGKNAEENIFEVGKKLSENNMQRGVTLSRQTNDPQTMKNINRTNINMSVYNNLQKRYSEKNIPVYTQLILALPGETYNTFKKGLEDILKMGIKNQMYVYYLQILPNTKLADEDYRKKFGISTKIIPIKGTHESIRPEGFIQEYEEIVTSTKNMSEKDWKRASFLSWTMQLLHRLKLGFNILNYLEDKYKINYTDFFEYIIENEKEGVIKDQINFFKKVVDSVLKGYSYNTEMPEFGLIYWPPEEVSFLNISKNKKKFYQELFELIKEYLKSKNKEINEKELLDIIKYQEFTIQNYKPIEKREINFEYNIPEYFGTFFNNDKKELLKKSQKLTLINPKDYNNNKKLFAKEIILWGSKNEKILQKIKWEDLNEKII